MRFGIVPLTELFRCARRVEIAKARVTQAEITLALRQRLFKRQFRFAIRVCRLSRITLFDRLLCRLAINGRRRREHEFLHIAFAHPIEQLQSIYDVVLIVLRRILD